MPSRALPVAEQTTRASLKSATASREGRSGPAARVRNSRLTPGPSPAEQTREGRCPRGDGAGLPPGPAGSRHTCSRSPRRPGPCGRGGHPVSPTQAAQQGARAGRAREPGAGEGVGRAEGEAGTPPLPPWDTGDIPHALPAALKLREGKSTQLPDRVHGPAGRESQSVCKHLSKLQEKATLPTAPSPEACRLRSPQPQHHPHSAVGTKARRSGR